MLISHKHKFITIDIPKTGTRSMRETLQPLGIIDIVGSPNGGVFYQHGNIEDCKKGFEERSWNINDYFKFTIVRNPWKRYVSFLIYKISKAEEYKLAKEGGIEKWTDAEIMQGKLCLEQWENLKKDETKLLKIIITNNPNQESFICYKNGEVGVDIIGQLESIYKDFAVFCENVGVLPIPDLKHSNKNLYEKPYTDYYNQELIDMVAEKEKWVINKFNYQP